jgi:hypothetical protein
MNIATKGRSRKAATKGTSFDFGSRRQHARSAQKKQYIVRSSYLSSGLSAAPKKLFSTSHAFVST